MKTAIIVGSKVFRAFLKTVINDERVVNGVDAVTFRVANGEISFQDLALAAETQGEDIHIASIASLKRMIKALKHALDQPIKVQFDDNSECFTLLCNF